MDHAREIERVEAGTPAGRMPADAGEAVCGADCQTCPKRLTCPSLARLKGGRT